MKLYYMKGACSMVPHTALEWIGKPYEAQGVTLPETKTPEYLAMNPQGAVPLLIDGELALSQNVAILQYLDALNPQAKLFGSTDEVAKARAWRWLAFLNADVHKAFGPLFHLPDYVKDEGVKADMQQAARASIVRMLGQADAHLASHPWLGDAISVADVYLFVILRWAKGMKIDLSSLPNLAGFFDRVAADPGVQKVMADEGVKA